MPRWSGSRIARRPDSTSRSIAAALDCRRAAADPDALFRARAALPRQVAACAALISESEAERP